MFISILLIVCHFYHESVPHIFTPELTGLAFVSQVRVGNQTILIVKFSRKSLHSCKVVLTDYFRRDGNPYKINHDCSYLFQLISLRTDFAVSGANDFGQLGDGTEENIKHPKKVKHLESEFVRSVSCGANCTAAIAEPRQNDGTISSGRLWVWGQNMGSDYPRLFWGAFAPNTVICQVSCGAVHVVALSEDGLLQAWGYNECGQLGRGTTCEGLQGPRVITGYAKHLDEPPELVKVIQVSCGEYHTAAISEDGAIYTWGLGNMGQLGHRSLQAEDKELLPRRIVSLDGIFVKNVACGGVHTCAVTVKGALYAWGGGQLGQLGLGPQAQAGSTSFIFNDSEKMLRSIPALVIPSGVELVACGHSHTLISTAEGRIHGWGYNGYGQAANEKSTYAWYPSPVDWCVGAVRKLAAGGGHSAVLTDACSLKELCEFKLAGNVNLANAAVVEDVAYRTSSDALVRLCNRLRDLSKDGGDFNLGDEDPALGTKLTPT